MLVIFKGFIRFVSYTSTKKSKLKKRFLSKKRYASRLLERCGNTNKKR